MDGPPLCSDTCGVLPWNAIERLRDHFGDYVLVLTCRACGHQQELSPKQLVARCRRGWDEPLATIVSRLRCRCGKKSVRVELGFNRKPRGWNKHPS